MISNKGPIDMQIHNNQSKRLKPRFHRRNFTPELGTF
uniref:Uncharacterized protein n=1 Tax=Anguilla anguilla TaxID=7936 RepID=A0A0E9W1X9_ANGAN